MSREWEHAPKGSSVLSSCCMFSTGISEGRPSTGRGLVWVLEDHAMSLDEVCRG